MSFKVNDKKLVKNILKYGDNDKNIKAKISTYGDKINTIFHDNKEPKQNVPYKCLSLIMLESVVRTEEKKYYSQIFLEECKYEEKNIKGNKRIDYDFDTSSSDKSDSEPDNSESESDSEKPSKKCDNNEFGKSSKKSDNNESD